MTILKSNPLLPLIAALIGFSLIENELLVADPKVKVTESKVEQVSQVEETKTTTVKLQDKIWYGKISANETKQLELNLLFPDEGKFFIETIALAYDRQLKVWKTLGQYYVNVTTKKGEEGRFEKSTGPKVTPYKIKAEGPVISSWDKTAKWDSLEGKSANEKPKAIPNPPRNLWRLHRSMGAGEAPLELLISFEPNPKINEPTKLLLSVSSTVPRDSVYVELLIPDSIKVIK